MARDTPAIRTLRRALETVGGEEHLAAAFNVPPLEVFLAALDIVASGRNPITASVAAAP